MYQSITKKLLETAEKMLTMKLITIQIVQGLIILKKFGVVHCDLKPENILFCSDNPYEKRVKIIDFGTSNFVGQQLYVYL